MLAAIQSSLLIAFMARSANAECSGTISQFTLPCTPDNFEANLAPGCTLSELELSATDIENLCKYEAPVQFVEINGYYQLDRRYFNGGGPLIDSTEPFGVEAGRILRFDQNLADSTLVSWPEYKATLEYNENLHGYSPNFNLVDSCQLNTVMCCFIDDVDNNGFQGGDFTTDVCRHDLFNSPKANHIKDGWSIFPNVETPTHCVGFTWEEGESSDIFKGNALYDISLRNTVTKGYYKSVPGAPLCGCIEQMPVVEKAGCRTAVGGAITYAFKYDAETGAVSASNSVDVTYTDCEEGDLAAHFKVKHADKADAIDDHLVGEGRCAVNNEDYLNEEKFLTTKSHDSKYIAISEEEGWKFVVGEGIRFFPPNIDNEVADAEFRALINAGCTNFDGSARDCIIRRFCDSCSLESHRDIYYKRITPIPEFGSGEGQVYFLDLFMNNWFSEPSNVLNTDFELYSTYEDALAGTNKWQFCNYNDPGIGFPRDCNVETYWAPHQWNSYIRGGGTGNHHGFYVELP
jgi:hypothetical protein